jgi:hypothetical protein
MNKSSKSEREQEKYFEIAYLLRGQTQWASAHSLGANEREAMDNFVVDYSPSHGVLVAVCVFGDDKISSDALAKLFAPMSKLFRKPVEPQE